MLTHLLELRRRAIYILAWFAILFSLFFYDADDLFSLLIKPLLNILPDKHGLIATQITSPVFTPLKLAANVALLLTMPFALYQFWRFVSPGLYKNEKKQLRETIWLSILLFVIGVSFCFYIVLPFSFQFFAHALPKEVRFMPDITFAIDFITKMILIFGICFQVPLACLLLVRLRLLTVKTLTTIRPYVIVGSFILGMLLTPPDVFSQVTLALPLCFLYEVGIILARLQKMPVDIALPN